MELSPDDVRIQALASAAAQGQKDALGDLIAATHLDVWRFCAYLVDQQSADDLTQETFLRAHRSLSGFRGDAAVRTWLLTIARRVCATELDVRSRRRDLALRVRPLIRPGARQPESAGVDLALLIADLQPERRAAFVLTQVVGCDYAEAAEICGCPVGTIRSRVARARADLIAALAGESEALETRPS